MRYQTSYQRNLRKTYDLLTISAAHKEEKKEEDQNKYIRKERYYSSYSRSFRVNEMGADEIDASYNNGILEIRLTLFLLLPETEKSFLLSL